MAGTAPSSGRSNSVPWLLAVIAVLLLAILVTLVVQAMRSPASPPVGGTPSASNTPSPQPAAVPEAQPAVASATPQTAPAPQSQVAAAQPPVRYPPGAAPRAPLNNSSTVDGRNTGPAVVRLGAPSRSAIPDPGELIIRPIAPTRLDQAGPTTMPSGAAVAQTQPAPGSGVILWPDAAQYAGKNQTITVQGKVTDAGVSRSGAPVFLNFTSDRKAVYIAVFKSALSGLPGTPEKTFLNHTIRVTGQVEEYQGRPEIKVNKADQIQVVD